MDKNSIINLKLKGISNRQVAKTLKLNRKTVARYWNEYVTETEELLNADSTNSSVRDIQERIVSKPEYDSSTRKPRKYTDEIDRMVDRILIEEAEKDNILGPNKQHLTNKQIHRRISEAGYDIGFSTLSHYIKLKKEKKKEAFIRQEYTPGQRTEYDFGDVKLVIDGNAGTYHMAVIASPGSRVRWAYLYDNMKKDVFMDSHVRYFEMMHGVPQEMVYDNMRNVVSRFVGKTEKELNPDLVKMSLYYGFEINVTNCFSGNEKGFVESSVKKLQKEIFAERYRFDTFEEACGYLEKKLFEINNTEDINREKGALRNYRPPLELGRLVECHVDKYSFIQIENNWYSVPDHLVGKTLEAKVYMDSISVYEGTELVADHKKIDGYHQMQVDIFHYLDTLTKKPGALKNSKALKCRTDMKTIYDMYFTSKPKEFIALVRENRNKSYSQLLEILKEHGKDTVAFRSAPDEKIDDWIAERARSQIAKISAMYSGGGACHDN